MSSYNIPDPLIQGFTYSSSFNPHDHLKRYCGRTVPSGSRASFSQLPELPADCLQLSLLGTALSRGKLLHPNYGASLGEAQIQWLTTTVVSKA